jgi:hypothetical protein
LGTCVLFIEFVLTPPLSSYSLPDTSHCVAAGAYDNIRMDLPPREQREIFIKSAENFGLWPQVRDDYMGRNMSAYAEFFLGSPDPEKGNAFSFKSQQQISDEETAAMTAASMQEGESINHGSSTLAPEADARLIPPPPPLTTQATNAPIAGCPLPGHPPNPCFNLACLPAAALELIAEILIFIPHILDGLIRGNFPDTAAGETQWGYFMDSNCALRCFEVDLMNTILDIVAPLVCVCHFLNLILPSSPQFPQPDFCCALVFAGDLIANTCQVRNYQCSQTLSKNSHLSVLRLSSMVSSRWHWTALGSSISTMGTLCGTLTNSLKRRCKSWLVCVSSFDTCSPSLSSLEEPSMVGVPLISVVFPWWLRTQPLSFYAW